MRVSARKLAAALFLGGVVAVLSMSPERGSASEEGLLEFDNFVCPGPCPIGAEECCAFLPPICVPGPCVE